MSAAAQLMLYVLQVGNYTVDRDYWGRPEDITSDRPYYAVPFNRAAYNTSAVDLGSSIAAGLFAAYAAVPTAPNAASYLSTGICPGYSSPFALLPFINMVCNVQLDYLIRQCHRHAPSIVDSYLRCIKNTLYSNEGPDRGLQIRQHTCQKARASMAGLGRRHKQKLRSFLQAWPFTKEPRCLWRATGLSIVTSMLSLRSDFVAWVAPLQALAWGMLALFMLQIRTMTSSCGLLHGITKQQATAAC